MLDRITIAFAALALASVAHAQEDADSAYVDVDGAAIEVTLALAAEACGMDEAAVTAAAAERMSGGTPTDPATAEAAEGGTMESDGTASTEEPATDGEVATAQGVEDPSMTEPANSDPALLALAICEVDVETAANLGIPTTAEIVTE